MLTVGFLSSQNYLSRTTFSGTLFSMYSALRAQDIDLVELGWPAHPGLGDRIRRKLDICQPVGTDTPLRARAFGTLVALQLRKQPCDVLFAPVASSCLAAIRTHVPIVYSSDTTFELYRKYYRIDADPAMQVRMEQEEKDAIRRSSRLLYPSRWAASSAVEHYGASPAQVDIAPYGANIKEPPPVGRTTARLDSLGRNVCKLLFVGVDFERKGGTIALDTLRRLRERGIDARMTMVGTTPPGDPKVDGLEVIAFINKNNPDEARRLDELYLDSHFMIFPTRADCSPIVLCEAAAYGLPVVSSDVGGIGDIVVDEHNGVLLPGSAPAATYADRVAALWSEPARYRAMVLAARRAYEERLNWTAWGRSAVDCLRQAAASVRKDLPAAARSR